MRLPLGMRAFTFSFRLPMPNSLPPSPIPGEKEGEDLVNYGRILTRRSSWEIQIRMYIICPLYTRGQQTFKTPSFVSSIAYWSTLRQMDVVSNITKVILLPRFSHLKWEPSWTSQVWGVVATEIKKKNQAKFKDYYSLWKNRQPSGSATCWAPTETKVFNWCNW